LTWDSAYGWIDHTQAAQTKWFNPTTGLVLSPDFARTIENSFQDFWISMLSDTKLHSQFTTSVPCSVTENVLVWAYAPFWLALPYGLALGLNAIAVVVGMYCFRENGCSMNTNFSTLVTTTRSADLDNLVQGQRLGYWPIAKEILHSRIRFGELVVPSDDDGEESSQPRTAFALPNNVKQMDEPSKYF
jgi:hypothetical protein